MILITEISISTWVWHDWKLILKIQAQNPGHSKFGISPLLPGLEKYEEIVDWNLYIRKQIFRGNLFSDT